MTNQKQYTLIVDGEDQRYEGLGELNTIEEAEDAAEAYVKQGNYEIDIYECIIENDEVVDIEHVKQVNGSLM